MRLDQIPLYQCHTPDPEVPFDAAVGALVQLRDEYEILNIGLSNMGTNQIRQALELTPIVSVQTATGSATAAPIR